MRTPFDRQTKNNQLADYFLILFGRLSNALSWTLSSLLTFSAGTPNAINLRFWTFIRCFFAAPVFRGLR